MKIHAHNSPRAVVAFMAAFIASVALAPGAHAATDRTGQRESACAGAIQSGAIDTATLRDLSMSAELRGISLEKAVQDFLVVENIRVIQESLNSDNPVGFAGIYFDPDKGLGVALWTDAAAIPEWAAECATISNRRVEYSLSELLAAQDELSTKLRGKSLSTGNWVDISANLVRVEASPGNRAEVAAIASTVVSSRSGGRDMRLPALVAVSENPAPPSAKTELYGGLTGVITADPSSPFGCTSGLTVRNVSTNRILTAGHCPGAAISYLGVSTTHHSSKYSGSHDWMLRTIPSPHTAVPKIKDSSSSVRWVTGTRSRSSTVIGETLCKYGKTTGYTCGVVSSKTYTPSWVKNATATFIKVDKVSGTGKIVADHDSGGPVFFGGNAYGIISGGSDYQFFVFMSVSYLPSGTYVLTH